MDKPYAPACDRNRDPILAQLRIWFADRHRVLELGSGTGQHAVHFAAQLPHLTWQTSDLPQGLPGLRQWLQEAALPNTPEPWAIDVGQWPDADHPPAGPARPSMPFDAVFSANTLHIMSWAHVARLFEGLGQWVGPDAKLVIYGPFRMQGVVTSAGNEDFDRDLRARDPRSGLRDLEAVDALAQAHGWTLQDKVAMPANNRCVLWSRHG